MLPIVISPDPILATVCEPCEPGDKSLKRLSKQMVHAMYKNYGCGIAAPQVGVTKSLVVIDVDWDGEKGEKNPIVLVNPEIVELAGEPEEGGEGCLSCPGVTVPVKRQPWARVQYYDLDGELWEIEGDGLLGRCLQHETDHLNGIDFGDRLSSRSYRHLEQQKNDLAHLYPEDWPVTPKKKFADED